MGATTMLISLLQLPNIRDYHINSFSYICTGGSPISIELQRQIQELMPNADIMEGYGLTECVSQGGAITPMGHFKPGYVGVPNLNDIKIMDLKNRDAEAPVNEAGEIAIKGPILTKGYWNQPEETDAVIRDGWFHTGDIGAIDEQGYLQYAGRLKELIKCSGFSVFPSEVEDLLYRHPAIAEVAVKGVHDPYRGESPKAYVVLKHGFVDRVTEGDLIEWCKENMAAYKRPREFEFVNDLPKSAVGKVLRRLL